MLEWPPNQKKFGGTLVFRESTGCNTPVGSIGVIIVKLAHAIGRALKSMEGRAGRWATFGTGVAVPFVARLPASGSGAPTSVSRGSRDHRVVATSSVQQGIRGSNCVHSCLVVSCAYRFSHGGRQANEKHGHKKICVLRNSRRQVLFEFPHKNARLEACACPWGAEAIQNKTAICSFHIARAKLFSKDRKDDPNRCRHPGCLKCPGGLAWAGWGERWRI